jgi:hypothetical protein
VRALQSRRRVDVLTWDGHPVADSEGRDALVAEGFRHDGPRMIWERRAPR